MLGSLSPHAFSHLYHLFCTIPPKKPANLLIDYSGVLKISDFGLAKIRPDPTKTEQEAFVMTGETGSYRFMAPEVSPILGRGLQNPLFYAFLSLFASHVPPQRRLLNLYRCFATRATQKP